MGLVPVTNTQTMAEDSAKPKGDPDTKNSADTKDSADPAFWETRYRKGVTPWEPGSASAYLRGALPALLGSFTLPATPPASPVRARALVPGCGSGHDARLLADTGLDVLAIDYAPGAVELARPVLGPHAACLRQADFFDFAEAIDAQGRPGFELQFERALLCALPRQEWPRWATRSAELVRSAGVLAGLFYIDDNLRGPPFGIDRALLHALLDPHFVLEQSTPLQAQESPAVFKGKEHWMVWRRR